MINESVELSEVYEQLSAANNTIAALTAWECATCGARFASRVAPVMLTVDRHRRLVARRCRSRAKA